MTSQETAALRLTAVTSAIDRIINGPCACGDCLSCDVRRAREGHRDNIEELDALRLALTRQAPSFTELIDTP